MAPNIEKRAIGRRRFGARARGPSSETGKVDCICRQTSPPSRVYIVDGTREILTSIVLRPRAETGVKCRQAYSASVQKQLSDDKTRLGLLIDKILAVGGR